MVDLRPSISGLNTVHTEIVSAGWKTSDFSAVNFQYDESLDQSAEQPGSSRSKVTQKVWIFGAPRLQQM